MKKNVGKRLLSLLLCLCMVIGFVPIGELIPARAASNVDGGLQGQVADVFTALGFDTSVEPEGYDANTVDNPYGRDKLPGTQIFEMVMSHSGGTYPAGKDNNGLGVSDVINGSRSGAKVPLQMFSAAAGDFDGDGLPGEVIYVGVEAFDLAQLTDSTMPLKLAAYDGKTGSFGASNQIGKVGGVDYRTETFMPPGLGEEITVTSAYEYDFEIQNLLQITAGDYDGDGYSEIAVYMPEQGNARVDVFKWMRDANSTADGWKNMNNWSVVWSHVLSNDMVQNMVSLVSADINMDGIDDLGIAHSNIYRRGELYTPIYFRDGTPATANILWGSRENMLQSVLSLDLKEEELGAQVRTSLTVGDINGDGYQELVITGQPLTDLGQNTTRSVIIYLYDSSGAMTSLYTGNVKPVDGKYEWVEEVVDGNTQTKKTWVSNNSFDDTYRSTEGMRTNAAVVRLEGYDYTHLYLDSCLYEFVEGSLRLKMSLDDPKYDGTNNLKKTWLTDSQYAEFGASSADINGNEFDQLYASYYTLTSNGSYGTGGATGIVTYTHEHYGGISGLSGDGKGQLTAAGLSDSQYQVADHNGKPTPPEKPCCYLAVPADVDRDTTLLEYTGRHWLTYQDPEILAVVAAAPYFEDVDIICDYDYAWQNTTSWSKTEGGGEGKTVQVDLEAGAYISQGSDFNELEVAALFTMEWVDETTDITEYTLTFETSQDEDAVAFFSIPTEHYEYILWVCDETGEYKPNPYTVSRPFQAVYQVLNLDYYESLLETHKTLPAIRGEILRSVPGDPSSYPSSTSGYDVIAKWNQEPAGVSFGNGAITQEITITHEESESYNLGAALDTTIGGGYDGNHVSIMAGITFSLNPSGGWVDYDISGTTISGTVTNMPLEFQDYGYYYDWSLFSYAASAGGSEFPVVSYVVNNVSEPPQLPDDFQQDVERTTSNTNVLTWSYDGDYSSFVLYRYFDFPVGGGMQEIARFEKGEAPFTVKIGPDKKPYYEFYYEDTNLAPYSEYEYAIQVERLSGIPPRSPRSAMLTARTKAAMGNPLLTVIESDGTNDGCATVYSDKTSSLIAQVNGPDGEEGSAYYTTIQYQWQKKNDKGKWEDLPNKTEQTLIFSDEDTTPSSTYRCRVNVITNTDNTAISVYTESVEVDRSKRSSIVEEAYAVSMAGRVRLYAKVVNAHTDSAAVPDGYVVFHFVNTATGAYYPVQATLDSTGVIDVISNNAPGDGLFRVTVSYSGSATFNGSDTQIYYICGQENGYAVEAPDYVTYGDGGAFTFQNISNDNGVAVATPVEADYVLSGPKQLVLPTPASEAEIAGMQEAVDGMRVEENKNYYFYVGVPSYMPYRVFSANIDGKLIYTEATGYWIVGDEQYLIETEQTGVYRVRENTPVGEHLVVFQKGESFVMQRLRVEPRSVVLQLPTVTRKQDANATMGDITYGQLELASGSWAPCDTDEAGQITGSIASASVNPTYTNTAGTVFNKTSKLSTCGYYVMGAEDTLENYRVTYQAGAMSVIGGNQPVTFGVRSFQGEGVGTLYLVSPDYAYTREDKGITMSQAVGSRVVFHAAPDEGYQVYDWYVDGVAQGITDNRFAFVMLNKASTVEVQFVFRPDTLIFGVTGATEGGTLTCSDQTLTSGSIVIPNTYLTYTATAKDGYHFKEWRYTELGNGTAYYAGDDGRMSSTFELLMPKTSCSLYAVFERDGYTLTYTDKNGIDGLTAWYWGNPSGDTTAPLEKIYVNSGDKVPGGTQIVIQPRDGYRLDEDYNYVSIGDQGVPDYQAGTYTLTLTKDTHVTGYALRGSFAVSVFQGVDYAYAFCTDAQITLTIDGAEDTYDCTQNAQITEIPDIPGGSRVQVTVTYPSYYICEGWNVNGTLHEGDTYTVTALGEDILFAPQLREKPVHKVTLADISGKGSYTVALPEGAGQEGNVVICHENDPLTIQVIPKTGYTVTYWNVAAANSSDSWKAKAASLKYQFPKLTADYTFTPVFSTTTYHSVSWTTLPYYGVTLTPEAGYLSAVASGENFMFTLSGGSYQCVIANDVIFMDSEKVASDYPNVYTMVDNVKVYTIRNICEKQTISVSAQTPVNTITVTPAQIDGYLDQEVPVTVSYTGTKPTHYVWSSTAVKDNGNGSFTYTVNNGAPVGASWKSTVTSYCGSTKLATVEVPVRVTNGQVSSITVTNKQLTAGDDGSFTVHTVSEDGKPSQYDFDASVRLYMGTGTFSNSDAVTWSLYGAQMRGTTIDSNGILTLSPKEQGTDDQIKVIATYHYSDGKQYQREVGVKLNRDSYVATEVIGGKYGTVNQVGYVRGGETVTVTAIADEGHRVTGWYINGVAVSGEITDTLTFTAEDMTHYLVSVELGHDRVDENDDDRCDICDEYDPAVLVTEENYGDLGVDESYIGYYAIANRSQMYWFANLVNGGNTSVNGVLLADIDLANRAWVPMGTQNEAFAPNVKQPFQGTFDGRGHVIRNLNVHVTDGREAGLFGRIQNATLKNFGVIDATVVSDPVNGKSYRAGVIAGEIHLSTAENLFSTGTLTVTTDHQQAGGLAGECADSHLISCYTTFGCLTDATAALPDSTTNCYYLAEEANADSVGENKSAESFASGEVAWLLNGESTDGIWKQTLDTDPVPGFTGKTVYRLEYCTGEISYTNDPDSDRIHSYDSNGFCHNTLADGQLCGAYEPAVKKADDTYEIENAGQLYWFAQKVNAGSTAINGTLVADILINSVETAEADWRLWTPMGSVEAPYTGTFDGSNHTVTGMKAKGVYVGLVGYLGRTGTVKNLGLINCRNSTNSSSNVYYGSIAGFSEGTIQDCFTFGFMGYSTFTGGIVGSNSGTVANCFYAGITNGGGCIAQVVGINYGTVRNCYADESRATNGYRSIIGANNGVAENYGLLAHEKFTSGEVAYLLGDAWGQTLGTDEYPVLGGDRVYCHTDCGGNSGYSNSQLTVGTHVWQPTDNCTESTVCTVCGEVKSGAAEHSWGSGSCTEARTCSVCGFTESEAAGHTWSDATCTAAKTCTICGATDGEALGHSWTDATCTAAKTCTTCGETEGDPAEHSFDAGVFTVDPTCAAEGTKTFTCTVCGSTHMQVVPATGNHTDTDRNGRCDVCNCYMVPARLYMASVSMRGNIAIHYYMLLSDEVAADKTAYMQFTMADGEVIKQSISDSEKNRQGDQLFYVFTCEVNAKEMTDDVVSQFFYSDGSTAEFTYSVRTYGNRILSGASDAKTKELISSMLRYGAACQKYFNYKTGKLADAALPAMDYTGMTISGFKTEPGQGTDLVKLYSASLLMQSETTLRFYFQVDSAAKKFTASRGGYALAVKQSGSLYYVDVVGIAARELDEMVTITINDGNVSKQISYNPMAYCATVANNTTGAFDRKIQDVACAMYLYNQAANVYFGETEA